jgi:hypothetical protein
MGAYARRLACKINTSSDFPDAELQRKANPGAHKCSEYRQNLDSNRHRSAKFQGWPAEGMRERPRNRGANAMKLPRRNFLHLAAGAAALPALSRIARAQSYPSRPVRVIVPFAPAGDTDFLARLIGQWLSERLGQPFIIENRPGAGTNIGTEAVVRASADGYTLLLASPPSAINATLYEKLNFNFLRDIVPVAGVVRAPFVMVVNPSVPAKAVPEFITYIRARWHRPASVPECSIDVGRPPK